MPSQPSTNYVTGIQYSPSSGISSLARGNGLTNSLTYNSRLQPTSITEQRSDSSVPFSTTPNWVNPSNQNNNGTLWNLSTTANGLSYTQAFGYDALNRLTSASEGSAWSQSYNYDQYGNMWMPTTSNGLPTPSIGSVAPTTNAYTAPNVPVTNRNLNSTYDNAGNLTVFASANISYDANNLQITAGSNAYAYDGLGQRVSRTVGAAPATYYVYDAFGQLSAEYTAAPLTALRCITCYLSYDHLGSTRMMTDPAAQIVALHDYAPFGQEIPAGVDGRTSLWGASDNVNQKFTGQERDSETNLDFFQARYMSSGLGRFMSPDPGNAGADLTNPQSWNGYGYVGGQPLVYTDPSGEDFGGLLNWLGGLFGLGSNGSSTGETGTTFYATGYCYGCNDPGPSGAGAPSHEGGGGSAGGGPTFYGTGLYLDPVSTPSTASLQPPPKTATNPCAGRDPKRLDFYTPRYYPSENRTVSPYQHILDRHVRPNSKPGTTRYIFGFGPAQMNYTQTMSVVMSMGRTTFSNSFPVAQGNGNLLYRFGVPPIQISTPIGLFTLKGIGQDLSGNWLNTNSLVVEDNCESVVTEFPTKP